MSNQLAPIIISTPLRVSGLLLLFLAATVINYLFVLFFLPETKVSFYLDSRHLLLLLLLLFCFICFNSIPKTSGKVKSIAVTSYILIFVSINTCMYFKLCIFFYKTASNVIIVAVGSQLFEQIETGGREVFPMQLLLWLTKQFI